MIPSAVRLAASARIRPRWRQLVAIGLLGGLVGGIAVASFAGARRTSTAYDRLVDGAGFPDVFVQLIEPRPGLADEIAALPAVERAVTTTFAVGVRTGAPTQVLFPAQAGAERVAELPVVEGRTPDPDAVDEVVLSEGFADALRLAVGDVIGHQALTDDEFADLLRDRWDGSASGPRTDLSVVGLVRSPLDVLLDGFPSLTGTGALAERLASVRAGSSGVWVHLRDASDGAALEREILELAGTGGDERLNGVTVTDLTRARAPVDDATDLVASALAVFGVVTALAGSVVVGQMVTRFVDAGRADASVLGSLGMDRRARSATAAVAGWPVVAVAIPTAAAVAAVTSLWTPLGVARGVEPDPGIDVNAAILTGGSVALAAVLALCLAISARVADPERVPRRQPGRPGRVPSLGASAGPWLTVTTALAVGTTGRRTPRLLALAGVATSVAAVIASGVFSSSLARLVEEPERWGWPGELSIEVPDPVRADVYAALDAAPQVAGYAEVRGSELVVEGRRVDAYTFQRRSGDVSPVVVEGRAPEGAEEVALGPRLLKQIGATVGDRVATDAGDRTVVGVALTPGLSDRSDSVSSALLGEAPDGPGFTTAIVRLADGVTAEEVPATVFADAEYGLPVQPAEVANLSELAPLAPLLAAAFAVIGLVAVGHTALSTGDRSRRDVAVLRAMGFPRRAAARAVLGATALVVGAAVALAVPLGMFVAARTWSAVAGGTDLGVAASYPPRVLLVVPVVGVLVVVAGSLAGRRSVGAASADLLRAE